MRSNVLRGHFPAFEKTPSFIPGDYLVEILECRLGPRRPDGTYFAADFTILESSESRRPMASRCRWVSCLRFGECHSQRSVVAFVEHATRSLLGTHRAQADEDDLANEIAKTWAALDEYTACRPFPLLQPGCSLLAAVVGPANLLAGTHLQLAVYKIARGPVVHDWDLPMELKA